jgi:antitoxin CptB
MTGTTRSSSGLDDRRKRLLFRCWHRGTREMDLILGRFADAEIDRLSTSDLEEFERLMEAPEPDLYHWIASGETPPVPYDSAVFRRLRAFHRGGESA